MRVEVAGVVTTVVAVLGLVQGWRLGVRRAELQLQRLVLALQALEGDTSADALREQVRKRAREVTARMLELQRQRGRFWILGSSMTLGVASLVVRGLPAFNASIPREVTHPWSVVLLLACLVLLAGVTARDVWEREGSPRFWERSGKG